MKEKKFTINLNGVNGMKPTLNYRLLIIPVILVSLFIGVFLLFAFDTIFLGNFNPIESGDFIYVEVNDGAAIVDLSEQGMEKETLIFPSTIDNREVYNIGSSESYWKSTGPIVIENAKSIYFPNNYSTNVSIKYTGENETVRIYLGNVTHATGFFIDTKNRDNFEVFSQKKIVDHYKSSYTDEEVNLNYSNVCYYLTDDDVYFVDDVNGTTVNVVPPAPYKDGYEFIGWYKDVYFREEWDFENDIVPEKEYDEEDVYIFSETKLYAKWERLE